MTASPVSFGSELRRRREAAGMSLTRLAALVHYSKSYLSKVETGHKPAPVDLARQCDAVLKADGALAEKAPARLPAHVRRLAGADQEIWMMSMADDGTGWFRPMRRRDALAIGVGAGAAISLSLGGPATVALSDDQAPVESYRALFDAFRKLGQEIGPSAVLPSLIAQTNTLRVLAGQAGGSLRRELLYLCARYAEYIGWMSQESGDNAAAVWWTDRAVEFARESGDIELSSYAHVRRALITLYQNDARRTIALARLAQTGRESPRVRGLAAQREAQGHALAGDYTACMRSLDRARDLLAHPGADEGTRPPLGTTNLENPVAMIHGWCLHDLGRPATAASILDVETARLPAAGVRSRARYGIRGALAHAAAGHIEGSCIMTRQLLTAVDRVSSATIATDLRRLAHTLSRFRTHPAVRDLRPRLVDSLRVAGT